MQAQLRSPPWREVSVDLFKNLILLLNGMHISLCNDYILDIYLIPHLRKLITHFDGNRYICSQKATQMQQKQG